MPDFTKRAIKASLIKLLGEMPLAKISVRAIVEDCGINRNSFYYHFSDIPSLVGEIIRDEVDGIIAAYPTVSSLDECSDMVIKFLSENKKAIYHIYNSVNRNIFEANLMKTCGYAVTSYMKTVLTGDDAAHEDIDVLITFLKCELFGLSIDWLESGMEDGAEDMIGKLTGLCLDMSERWLHGNK